MRRLSKVFVQDTKGIKLNPTMRVYLSPTILKFSSYMYTLVKQYKYVEFIEDGDGMFAHFNNESGYRLSITKDGKSNSRTYGYKACSRDLVQYFWQKYKASETTNVLVFVVGVNFAEEFEGGIKYQLMYRKSI